LSIVKNGWGSIFHRYIISFNNTLITGSVVAMFPSFIEGNLYDCPRPHIPLSGEVEGKREPTLPLPLFGKGRVVAGFIPASVGDKPRPYGVCFKMPKKQREGKFEIGCPRPHIPLSGEGERKREPTLPLPLFGKVEEVYFG